MRLLPAILAVTAAAVPHAPTASATDVGPLVVVGIPPLKFVVEALAGEHVAVEVLLPPGTSPHTYEPTPRQLAALDQADLYLEIGVPFEGPLLAKVTSVIGDLRIVDCRRGVELVPVEGGGGHHPEGAPDPHIWLDPVRMKQVAANIAGALADLMPDLSQEFDRNLSALNTTIDKADDRAASLLTRFAGRTMVVFHPAYGYFAHRYGLHQLAVEVEGKAPSARQLAAIVDRLGGQPVRAIFVQPQFSTTAAQRVADAIGCRIVELDPLAENYPANLELMADRVAAALGH